MPTFLSQKAKQRSTRMCQILSISGCIRGEAREQTNQHFYMFNAIFVVLIAAAGVLAQPRFEDVTAEAIPFRLFEAEGMSVGDYNNDGWTDLFIAEFVNDIYDGGDRIALLYNGGDGSFVRDAALLPDGLLNFDSEAITGEAFGPGAFGDYDRDGDLDIYLPLGVGWLHRRRNALLRNDRGIFTNVTTQAGLTQELSSAGAIWLDYNRDGHLDLYVTDDGLILANLLRGIWDNYSPSSYHRLYRNNQDGSFTDVTVAAGLDVPMPGFNIAAPDVNDDGWPDVHIAIHHDLLIFLNDGQGRFPDATTTETFNPGIVGIAIGDIDNDGDLDLFQPNSDSAGFGDVLPSRPVMMLNLGDYQFLDVTEGVGIDFKDLPVQNATFADLDNDGDLDLVTGRPLFLFINDGQGFFSDVTERSGLPAAGGVGVLPVDYDGDGCLDLIYSNVLTTGDNEFGGVFRNRCNNHHYLRVELVGEASGRDGIGARINIRSGALRQTRELLGGTALWQQEAIAHFGLGTRTLVDTLEVRWPSGQIDVHTAVAVDRQIRLFEGKPGSHTVLPTNWEHALPDTIVVGESVEIAARVQSALFAPDARIDKVTADLSSWGGGDAVPLDRQGDGSYLLTVQTIVASGQPGRREVAILIEQSSSHGPMWTRLVHPVQVLPTDLPTQPFPVYQDGLALGWELDAFVDHGDFRLRDYESEDGRAAIELRSTGQVFRGSAALAVQVDSLATPDGPEFEVFRLHFRPLEPVEQQYRGLRFAFHSGTSQSVGFPFLSVYLNGRTIVGLTLNPAFPLSRFLLDESIQGWQVVEVPLDYPGLEGPIESIEITGWLQGTFYLDEIELLPRPRSPTITAVAEEKTSTVPSSFALHQNYPNPFNSGTVIRFELPQAEEVELAVYNLAGQKVMNLVQGRRDAGSYTLRWDGRDARGRELASGVYLYRLQVGKLVETRKLLLLR